MAPISLQFLTGAHKENVGIPLLHATRLKKTWMKKEFKNTSRHLDKFTSACDIQHRMLFGIDEDSECLGVHCDFSQDLAHAR